MNNHIRDTWSIIRKKRRFQQNPLPKMKKENSNSTQIRFFPVQPIPGRREWTKQINRTTIVCHHPHETLRPDFSMAGMVAAISRNTFAYSSGV